MPEPQLPLWGDGRKPLARRYQEWRTSELGADVAHQVEQLALARAAAGETRISINLLFEQVRQVRHMPVDNSFRALLARELRTQHAELRDRIHIKERRGERAA